MDISLRKKPTDSLLCFILLLAWLFFPIDFLYAATEKASGDKDLSILFTHDLHSYFLPHRTLSKEGKPLQEGGYARLAYVINESRRSHRDKTILVDAGDFAMGTLFHTLFMTEAFELRLMGTMGYDVVTLGNHDFDFHPDGLARMLTTARLKSRSLPALVASNVVLSQHQGDATLKKAFAEYPVTPYTIIKRNGLRIGLFGIIGKDAAVDTPFARPVTFSDPVQAAERMTDLLKNKEHADLVICLSHSGTNANQKKSEDEILAKAVPQIDIIISGHTHTVLPQPLVIGRTIIVSCGCYGKYLGSLELRFNKKKGIALTSYALKNITASIPEDQTLATKISVFKKIVNRNFLAPYHLTYDEAVASSDFSLETLSSIYEHPRETGLGNLITDAYRYAIKQAEGARYRHVHFALQPLGVIRDSLQQGNITTADVFQVLSLGIGPDQVAGYPLVAFYITGKELKDILEVHTTIAPLKKSDAYLQVSGVTFTYNPRRAWFDRITSVRVQDEWGHFQPLDKNSLYRACANFYTANLIEYIASASYGLIKVKPKDFRGNLLPDLQSAMVRIHQTHELKEWSALTMYLRSFKKTGDSGLPKIPMQYSQPEGRYQAQPSWNPIDLIRGGNVVTYGLLTISLFVLFLWILVICGMIKKLRRYPPRR